MAVKRAPVAEMIPIVRAAVEEGKPVEMTVTGNSMKPLLKNRRSIVRLKHRETYAPGDIVLFRRDNGDYVLHRICRIHDGLYDILGDNVPAPDRDIRPEQLIAAVCAYSRKGERWHENDRIYRFFLPMIRKMRFFARRLAAKLGVRS